MFRILFSIEIVLSFNSNIKNLPELSHSFPIVAFFYSPWCPHCVPILPAWKNLTKKYENDTSFIFGLVDCSFNVEPCKISNGYPRMILFRDEKKQFLDISKEFEELEKTIISNISKARPYKFPIYEESKDQIYPAYVIESPFFNNEIKKEIMNLQISLPQFSSHFYFKENPNEKNRIFKYYYDSKHYAILKKEINKENINNFILDQEMIPFGKWDWNLVFESPRAAIFLIYFPKEKSIIDPLRKISYNYAQNFIFTKIKYTLFEKSFKHIGLGKKDLPAIFITDNKKYKWNLLKKIQINDELIEYFDAANNNQIEFQNSTDLTEIFRSNLIEAYEEVDDDTFYPYFILIIIILSLFVLRYIIHLFKKTHHNHLD